MNKFIAKFILLLVSALCFSPVKAYDFSEGDFGYTILDVVERTSSVELINKELAGEVVIPNRVDYKNREFSVVSIEEGGFCDSRNITSVVISEGITSLNEGCFKGCLNLKEITIPKSVVEIYQRAFSGCGIININLPESLEVLHGYVFENCLSLESVEFNNHLNIIESNCFVNCQSLKNILWPSKVLSIESATFRNCNINSITFPSTLKELSSSAFWYCQVNELYIEGEKSSETLDLVPDEENTGVYSQIKNIYIKRRLEKNSYDVNRFALKINGETNLYLGSDIGSSFSTYILNYVNINLLHLDDSNTTLEIQGTTKWYPKKIYMGRNFTNIDLNGRINILSTQLQSIVFSDYVTSLPPYIFEDCPIEEIELPSSLNSIKGYTFYHSKIENLIVPDSVTEINSKAFYGSKLRNIFIGNGVETIYTNTFAGLDLNILNLGTGLKSIEEGAFQDCDLHYLLCKNILPPNCDKKSFTQEQYLNSQIVVPKESFESYLSKSPWNVFFNINYGSQISKLSISPSSATLKEGNSLQLIVEYMTEDMNGFPIIENIVQWDSTDPQIASINSFGVVIANTSGFCNIKASIFGIDREISGISQVSVEQNPDRYKFKELEDGTAALIANDYQGIIIIPERANIGSKELIVTSVDKDAFKDCQELSGIILPGTIHSLPNDLFRDCLKLNFLAINYGKTPLRLGSQSHLSLSNEIIPFPNPTNVDERRTGFRNGYYDGLFYGLPIEYLVINRDIELLKYYEQTMGNSTSSYSTVYNDIVYYPPFYGLKNLKYLEIGENVLGICKNQIEAVVNATPIMMEYTNFGNCDNIEVVVSNTPNAPIGGGFTQTVYENASLFLPNGGIDSYRTDDYWKKFSHINETSFILIEAISFEYDEVTLDVNESKMLNPIINPSDASIKALKWNSSNASIVNVSEDGTITSGTKEGDAIITATSCDGSDISTSIKVVVQEGAGLSDVLSDNNIDISVDNGKIYVRGKAGADMVYVYNVQGQLITSTTDNRINIDSKGIYIVKINSVTKKIIF